MNGFTNQYIEKVGKKLFKNNFIGVFPSDVFPKKIKLIPSAIIFNLSKHYEAGTHFVSVIILKKKILFFDSLGDELKNKSIMNFIRKFKNKKKYIQFKIPLQSSRSSFCGIFALAFIKAILNKDENFFQNFEFLNDDRNDKIVLNYLE